MKKFILLIFTCFGLSFGCSKKYTPDSYPKARIHFGSGGGVTGAITEYILLENGQLFKKSSLNETMLEAKKLIGNNQTKQLFSNYEFLGLNEVQVNKPGNLYYFVQHLNGDKDHKMTWGGGGTTPDKLKTFYTLLNNVARQAEFAETKPANQ